MSPAMLPIVGRYEQFALFLTRIRLGIQYTASWISRTRCETALTRYWGLSAVLEQEEQLV